MALKGEALRAWARERALEAVNHDAGVVLLGVSWDFVTLAIVSAYLQGAVDTLKDEIASHRA